MIVATSLGSTCPATRVIAFATPQAAPTTSASGIGGPHVSATASPAANESPGEHGLMVQKMLDGVYESAEKGREVVIE